MPSVRAALAMLPRDFSTAATISLRSLSRRRSARLLPSSVAPGATTGADGACVVTVGIGPAVEGPDHHIEGVVQVIGLPTGEFALGDSDFRDHAGFAFFLSVRCSI